MFGYILPEKPELKIKEYELFKAYYCGVCKSMGKTCGQFARATLTYDAAFLAILLSAVKNIKPDIKRERCIVHPIRKRFVARDSEVIDYCSDMNVLLAYYNLKDNWNDEHSIFSGIGALALKSSINKLKRKYSDKCAIIKSRLKELAVIEKEKCSSMDRAAEPFARLMEEITACRELCKDDNVVKALRWIGYNLGKWIYLLDAYNDMEENIKNKTYNPLIYQYSYNGESIPDFKERIRDRVEFNLTYSLSQITKAYELLKIRDNSAIIENIIYMGMLRKTENILGIGGCSKIGKSV